MHQADVHTNIVWGVMQASAAACVLFGYFALCPRIVRTLLSASVVFVAAAWLFQVDAAENWAANCLISNDHNSLSNFQSWSHLRSSVVVANSSLVFQVALSLLAFHYRTSLPHKRRSASQTRTAPNLKPSQQFSRQVIMVWIFFPFSAQCLNQRILENSKGPAEMKETKPFCSLCDVYFKTRKLCCLTHLVKKNHKGPCFKSFY